MNVSQNVLEILDRSEFDGSVLRLPDEQFERQVYLAVNKVIESAGGKWNRKNKGHIFEGSSADAIEPILLTGTVTNTKQEFGAFFTPSLLARQVVAAADIQECHRILEPSAGIGNILRELPGGTCRVAVEINEEFAKKLYHFGDVHCADFLNCSTDLGLFDRVVMNPPFAKQADILHVFHATKFLKPHGRLVAIMSAGVVFRSDKRSIAFREMLSERGGTIEPLPDDSFKSSGTSVKTVLVSFSNTSGFF